MNNSFINQPNQSLNQPINSFNNLNNNQFIDYEKVKLSFYDNSENDYQPVLDPHVVEELGADHPPPFNPYYTQFIQKQYYYQNLVQQNSQSQQKQKECIKEIRKEKKKDIENLEKVLEIAKIDINKMWDDEEEDTPPNSPVDEKLNDCQSETQDKTQDKIQVIHECQDNQNETSKKIPIKHCCKICGHAADEGREICWSCRKKNPLCKRCGKTHVDFVNGTFSEIYVYCWTCQKQVQHSNKHKRIRYNRSDFVRQVRQVEKDSIRQFRSWGQDNY